MKFVTTGTFPTGGSLCITGQLPDWTTNCSCLSCSASSLATCARTSSDKASFQFAKDPWERVCACPGDLCHRLLSAKYTWPTVDWSIKGQPQAAYYCELSHHYSAVWIDVRPDGFSHATKSRRLETNYSLQIHFFRYLNAKFSTFLSLPFAPSLLNSLSHDNLYPFYPHNLTVLDWLLVRLAQCGLSNWIRCALLVTLVSKGQVVVKLSDLFKC